MIDLRPGAIRAFDISEWRMENIEWGEKIEWLVQLGIGD